VRSATPVTLEAQTGSPRRITVLCVDDHRIVREGLRMIINSEPDMVVIDAAATGGEAVMRYREHSPDITLMDLQLPDISGVEAIREIRRLDANARIIVLTMYKGDEDIHRAMGAGASTYLLKDTLSDDLPRIVREVHAGGQALPPDVAARLEERAASPTLTPREVEVMRLVAAGRRDKEIAVALAISSQTARVHMKNIFLKLGVSDRTEAMSVAIRRGIIHID
jgi:two-component system NarL family response regulator